MTENNRTSYNSDSKFEAMMIYISNATDTDTDKFNVEEEFEFNLFQFQVHIIHYSIRVIQKKKLQELVDMDSNIHFKNFILYLIHSLSNFTLNIDLF